MVENPTTNHNLSRPPTGSETGSDQVDWGQELNRNMSVIDGELLIIDIDAEKSTYIATDNAVFYATDTEKWYIGDGSTWVSQSTTGTTPNFESATIDGILEIGSNAYVSGSSVLTAEDESSLDAGSVDGHSASDFVKGDTNFEIYIQTNEPANWSDGDIWFDIS